MQLDTVLALASCTKLMTAIAVLQCVERGQLDLDVDVALILPEVGKYGIITGFDDSKNEAILIPKVNHVTLRQLLTHTSGQAYDLVHPLLIKWRASRGEEPWTGPTIEDKTTVPLIFEPGTAWAYGGGSDWAGKIVERVTGQTLEEYMKKHIWTPLGIKDLTFWPKTRKDMEDRMADISMLGPDGKKVFDVPPGVFDITYGATDCSGGAGAFGTPSAFFTLLQAVLRKDTKLLKPESYEELFRPQLNEQCRQALNDLILNDQVSRDFLSVNVPVTAKKNWSLAGLLVEEDQPGWVRKNTILWGGLPCLVWFCDREAGLCGFAGSQVLPPMAPPIMKFHESFQRGIYDVYAATTQ
ncbi:hypothetical protein G7Y89_g14555 [Cudoniella acicularis]|uniref:Beta-lactamase-related domain-containing protein n=1 Tax=Cudoniella acicularis TaxID=354080 RepID=A0A8H4R392_9HELO|nr:hypothetical protein G7Y89_g14555 [Cudoniella acicularis]